MLTYKMKLLYILFFVFFSLLNSFSQLKSNYYELNLIDGRSYHLTMNQSNEIMLQSLRGVSKFVDLEKFNNKERKVYTLTQTLLTSFCFN